jgi:hypothetical protein
MVPLFTADATGAFRMRQLVGARVDTDQLDPLALGNAVIDALCVLQFGDGSPRGAYLANDAADLLRAVAGASAGVLALTYSHTEPGYALVNDWYAPLRAKMAERGPMSRTLGQRVWEQMVARVHLQRAPPGALTAGRLPWALRALDHAEVVRATQARVGDALEARRGGKRVRSWASVSTAAS